MEQAEDGNMELGMKITLPRGVPVETFVSLCRALEHIIRAFVEGVGLPGDEVQIWVGQIEESGRGTGPRPTNDPDENGGEGSNAQANAGQLGDM